MSEENNADRQPSVPTPPPVYQYPPPPWWVKQPRPSLLRRIGRGVFILLFILSVMVNIQLGILLSGRVSGLDMTVISSGDQSRQVAVFDLSGTIDQRQADTFELFYRAVRDTDAIKAVVLRVDSGGGGIAASDQIHNLVNRIRQTLNKPVVVSMGSTAASGGYYVSAPANEIFAEPGTITGSIGVIAIWPVVTGLMDKIGVEMVTIRSTDAGEWKARHFNSFEPADEKVLADIQAMLDSFQQRFETVVKEGRGDRLATGDGVPNGGQAPLNGQVFLADEALRLGLVDKIGYQSDAVSSAAELANLKNPHVVRYSRRLGLGGLLGASEASALTSLKSLDPFTSPRIMMLWRAQ